MHEFPGACSVIGRQQLSLPSNQLWSLTPEDAEAIVLSALHRLSVDGKPVALGPIAKDLRDIYPAFDPRIFGRRTMSGLLSAMPSIEVLDHKGLRCAKLVISAGETG